MAKNSWDLCKESKFCRECKKEFYPWKRSKGLFCSSTCQRIGRKMRDAKMVSFACKACGTSCNKPKYLGGTFEYCSIQCMANMRGKNMRGENNPKWKGGDNRTGSHAICDRIKKEVGLCEKCGSKEKLQTHHKISVSQRPDLVAVRENIEVICVECHAKEHPEYEGMLLGVRKRYSVICKVCGTEVFVQKCRLKRKTCCSIKCSIKNAKEVCMRKYGKENKDIEESRSVHRGRG